MSATVATYASGVTIEAIHQCLGSYNEPRQKERRREMIGNKIAISTVLYDTYSLSVPGSCHQ